MECTAPPKRVNPPGIRFEDLPPIDLVLLTHPHLDHLGGFLAVLGAFPVRSYLDSGYPQSSPAYGNLLRALEERKIPVLRASAGRKIDLGGGATLTLLGPPSPFINSGRSDVNANSVVTRLTYGSAAAVLGTAVARAGMITAAGGSDWRSATTR